MPAGRAAPDHEDERAEIAAVVERRTGVLPEEDLHVLGLLGVARGPAAGLAAHHAGLVPAFKETVEECSSAGWSRRSSPPRRSPSGINMPARTVVLERLVKWNGEAHVDVTPGEYTQLTGRAGRRGIDVEGHAVVVWAPGMDPSVVAGLASTRTYPLRSSFRPSYNMAVNLVGRSAGPVPGSCSAARSPSSRPTGRWSGSPGRRPGTSGTPSGSPPRCTPTGRRRGYARLRRQISDREKELSRDSQARRRMEAAEALAALRPGDVIRVPSGRRQGLAVVLDPG